MLLGGLVHAVVREGASRKGGGRVVDRVVVEWMG